MKNIGMAIVAALSLAPSFADEAKTGAPAPQTKQETMARSTANRGEQKQIDRLAAEFKVNKQEIIDLRHQGLGWGEIRHALAISQKSGKPVSEILALRKSGMGWGEIARKYGFTLGDVARKGRQETRVRDERENSMQGHGTSGGMGMGHGGPHR